MSDSEYGHNTASNDEKVAGIVEQMRGDISQGNITDVADALRQRLADADVTVSDDEFEKLLASL